MLDDSRKTPVHDDGDPCSWLSRDAKLRIDDAYLQQQAIRDEAAATIEARLRGREWDDAAFERWSTAKIEAAYTVLAAYVREFQAIGKRGTELRSIIDGELEAAVNSLGLSGQERNAVLSRLYLLRPQQSEKVEAISEPAKPTESYVDENSEGVSNGDAVARDRKATLKTYQNEFFAAKRQRLSHNQIGKACGWSDRTIVERWLRNDPRVTSAHDRKIRSILAKKPHLNTP